MRFITVITNKGLLPGYRPVRRRISKGGKTLTVSSFPLKVGDQDNRNHYQYDNGGIPCPFTDVKMVFRMFHNIQRFRA